LSTSTFKPTTGPWANAWQNILTDMKAASTFKQERIIVTPQASGIEIIAPTDPSGFALIHF